MFGCIRAENLSGGHGNGAAISSGPVLVDMKVVVVYIMQRHKLVFFLFESYLLLKYVALPLSLPDIFSNSLTQAGIHCFKEKL